MDTASILATLVSGGVIGSWGRGLDERSILRDRRRDSGAG